MYIFSAFQNEGTVSIAELLRRKLDGSFHEQDDTMHNTNVSGNDPEYHSGGDSNNDESMSSQELEQRIDDVFDEEDNRIDFVNDELVEEVPVLFPELAPIMWTKERTFNNRQEIDQFLIQEGWAYRSQCTLNSGVKTLYRCKKMKRQGEQCQAEVYILHKVIINDDDELQNDDNEPNFEENAEVIIEPIVGEVIQPAVQPEAGPNIEAVIEPAAQLEAGPNIEAVIAPVEENNQIGMDVFELYRKNREHNHEELNNLAKPKVKEHVEKRIIQLVHLKPQTIIFELRDDENIEEDDQPTMRQVRNVIQTYKNRTFGKDNITMNILTEFVEQNMRLPSDKDPDRAFILSFERSPSNDPKQYFRFFITTRRLLEMSANSKNLHADATYKVTTEKLPLIVVGSTDMNRTFHLIGLTITSNETAEDYRFTFQSVVTGIYKVTGKEYVPETMVSDADPAIHKGNRMCFGDKAVFIIMCYAHVMSNVEKKYTYNRNENKQQMMDDLRKLHLSPDERQFKIGAGLFVKKWKDDEPAAVKKINGSFFRKCFNWFIGAYPRVPKTNNGLERFNGSVKIFQTQFERKPLKQFNKLAMKIVQQRSKQYKIDKAPFQEKLQISPRLMEDGIQYTKQFVNGQEMENGDIDFFVFRTGINEEITLDIVEEFRNREFETFNEFAANFCNIWKITFPKDSALWKRATCTCPAFDEKYMCKHIIGIAKQIGALDHPEINYDNEPLFKSKKGRPKRATAALNRD